MRLQVQSAAYHAMNIELVAPSSPVQLEPQRRQQVRQITEVDIADLSAGDPRKQSGWLHLTNALFRDRFFSIRAAQTLYSGMREVSS